MDGNRPIARRISVLLPSLSGGGAQRRVVELINGFIDEGRDVDLLLPDPRGELRDSVNPRVRIVTAGGPSASRHDASIAIREVLRERPPDALLSGSAYVQSLAIAACGGSRPFPLVLRADSHPYRAIPWSFPRQRLLEPIRRRKRLAQYASADLVIAVAADVAAAIAAANPTVPVVTIRNPVVSDSFLAYAGQPVELPWPDEPGVPIIVGVGRLAMAKDFPTLLRAFADLRRSRPARLAILGDGSEDERESLLRLARRLGIQDSFALPGPTDRVAAWLSRADVFVSSSIWEGCQAALIEALAVGCPAVATSCVGSTRDLLSDQNLGILVPPREPRLMARAIAAQLDRAGRQRRLVGAVADSYGVEKRAAEYLDAIDLALENFGPRQGRSDWHRPLLHASPGTSTSVTCRRPDYRWQRVQRGGRPAGVPHRPDQHRSDGRR